MSAQTLKGPLTAFDPPSSCFDQLWYNSRSDSVLGNPYDTKCKPSGWNTDVRYSPALCPSSYYSANGRRASAGTVVETIIDCCPSSFIADPGTFSCLSPIDLFSPTVLVTFSSDQSLFTTTLTSPTGGINAHSIQVRYQSSDLELLGLVSGTTATSATTTSSAESTTSTGSTTSQSLVPTASSTSASSTTPTSNSASASSPSSSLASGPSGSLSTGAKAGIGIGIACGVILVLAAVWVVIRTRKSKIASAKQPPHYEDHSERPAEKYTHQVRPSELAVPVSELSDSPNPSRNELP